jgi:hypothetical protein
MKLIVEYHTHTVHTCLWSWSDPELSAVCHTVGERGSKTGLGFSLTQSQTEFMSFFLHIHSFLSFLSLQCVSSSTAEGSFTPESPG